MAANSMEGKPQPPPNLFAQPLGWLTQWVLRFPTAVIIAALALAMLSLAATVQGLSFRTSRLDLLNPQSSYNKLWIKYIDEFGDADDAVVVVEGSGPDVVVPVLEELSAVLSREDRLFHAVLHEVDLTKIRAKGLHYLPLGELDRLESFLSKIDPIIQGAWSQLNLGQMVAQMNYRMSVGNQVADRQQSADAQRDTSRFAISLLESLRGRGQYVSPWQGMNDSAATISQLDSEYLLTQEGRLGFVLLRLTDRQEQFAKGSEAIGELRRVIAQVQARHLEAEIGLTGLPVMENDEMTTSQRDMLKAGAISLVGVACLFIAGFGGVRHPLITVITVLLAMAWTFGFVTVTIGHLNILSMSFGVILIGLGIDFGIHYVARYLHLRRTVNRCDHALVQTANSIGPGILTGGITTCVAFFAAGLTEFTGIAELGVIAGGGIFLCILAALLLLPAMIYTVDRHRFAPTLPNTIQPERWLAPLFRSPLVLLVATLLPCAFFGTGISKLRYDHNLLNLQPVDLESVRLERKLLTETDQSVWFALSIAETREELLRRKQQFLELATVDRTEEIVSLLPPDHDQKQPVISRIQKRLATLPERPPLIPETPPDELGRQLALLHRDLSGSDAHSSSTRRTIEDIRDVLRRMPLADSYARLSDFQQRIARDLLSRLHTLQSMADPEPPQLTDLPDSLVTRFVGKNNRHLLKIYGVGDIWNMHSLEAFVADVKRIDSDVTGKPLQTYYASRQMQQSYIHAACYSLIAVIVILLLDFRRIHDVFLALVPMGLGISLLFGIMGLLDIPLNPANMIVLPLILGIGIDDGVHVVHDFRRQMGRFRLSSSTTTAILLTSLTTIIGFGSLMIAGHQGLQSLGRVLTIGVSCCLFTSVVILPALLTLVTWNWTVAPEVESSPATATLESRTTRVDDAENSTASQPTRRPFPANSAEQLKSTRTLRKG